jgi:Immunity protein 8
MTDIRPVLRGIHSPDVVDLGNYSPDPEEAFGVLLQAMFGPSDSPGEESFDIVVCNPKWIERRTHEGIFSGRHHLIVASFDYEVIRRFLLTYAEQCCAKTWQQVGEKLARIGKWEFEDYTE